MKKSIEIFDKIVAEKRMVDLATTAIHWDLETQTPKKGMELLSNVVGYLSSKSYELGTSEELINAIEGMNSNKSELSEIKVKELEEVSKDLDKMKKIPADEYVKYSELTAKAQGIWAEAREKSDFSMFKDTLEEIIGYQRKFVEYRGYEGHPYNTLLDDYEPGMTVEKLDEFFDYLRKELVPFLKKINEEGREVIADFLKASYSIESQKKVSKILADHIKFDFDRGVLSESAHPFTLNFNRNDVRLTTRYEENWLPSSMFGTIHEGGHGLYEQGIGDDLANSILGTGTSMGIHESQSRFYENMLGRSIEFWKPIYADIQKELKPLANVSLEDFYRGINKSEASLIRVEADEMTYSLHIMVRYEIEKMMMEGKVEVEDLPRVWNEKMEEYLGVVPKNDAEGVLQDVHWACGLLGYFPSYALGNVYASQIYQELDKELDIKTLLEKKELARIRTWLTEKIHKYGKSKKPVEIIEDICNEGLNGEVFIEYLKEKYTKIYL